MDRILKEVAMAKSNVLYQNLLGETDKNHTKKNLSGFTVSHPRFDPGTSQTQV